MGMYFNGNRVAFGELQYNTVVPQKVFFNGVQAWQYKADSGSQVFTTNGTFTVPEGYTEVTICMIGGGGSGDGTYSGLGGGYSGQIISQTVTGLTPGQQISVVVSPATPQANGVTYSGGSTSFGAITASGGAGNGYAGNGAARSGCWGSSNDGLYSFQCGLHNETAYGGQAGFGNGGNGSCNSAGAGGVGAGGGEAYGGIGGRGEVRVSWTY